MRRPDYIDSPSPWPPRIGTDWLLLSAAAVLILVMVIGALWALALNSSSLFGG